MENNKTFEDSVSEQEIRKLMPGDKGYLGFYLFDPKDNDDKVLKNFYKDVESPLIGFALSFPEKPLVNYNFIINKQKQIQLNQDDEDEDDDEFDDESEE